MKSCSFITISVIMMLLITGCDSVPSISSENDKKAEAQKFEDLYPKELADVTQIQMLNGNGGARIEVTDQKAVQSFLNEIKDIMFIPEENQEMREGFNYAITLMEGAEATLTFGTGSVGGTFYDTEPDILPYADEFFEKFDEEPNE